MSNKRKLTRLNPGSGQRARPKQTWRGYRPPRSALKRWRDWMAQQHVQDQLSKNRLKLPEPEPTSRPSDAVTEWAEANGIVITPWQADMLDKAITEGEIKVG